MHDDPVKCEFHPKLDAADLDLSVQLVRTLHYQVTPGDSPLSSSSSSSPSVLIAFITGVSAGKINCAHKGKERKSDD